MSSQGLTTATRPGMLRVPIVTYNVLSDKLATVKSYPQLDAANLDPEVRYQRVVSKLEKQIDDGQPVIALQEVSALWSGRLHSFFFRRNYVFVSAHYGKPFNGYMGVALAFPQDRFMLTSCERVRLADTKSWPASPAADKPATPSFLARMWASVASLFAQFWQLFAGRPAATPQAECPWERSKQRNNIMLSMLLQSRDAPDVSLSVSTYHMPCAFRNPPVMTIHSALAAQHAHRAARGNPYVLLGDFNLKPGDPGHRLITTGSLRDDDAGQPPEQPHDPWRPTVPTALRSAYVSVTGSEPRATNHTLSFADHQPFTDCLDYIFMSPGVSATVVGDLPDVDSTPPCPNDTEPSDHWLLRALLEVRPAAQE